MKFLKQIPFLKKKRKRTNCYGEKMSLIFEKKIKKVFMKNLNALICQQGVLD